MANRRLPAVDALARRFHDSGIPGAVVTEIARSAISQARAALARGEDADPGEIARRQVEAVRRNRAATVINATGVLLHTNLGRALWAEEAVAAAAAAAAGYQPVEFDLSTGRRGKRGGYVSRLLTALTGAEAALAVNNNAGGLLLALAALGAGGNIVVSRGELIEIGGSFRLPELMAASGGRLIEVGTTNRTRVADYAGVVDEAAVILKVHPSNYRIEGFTGEVSVTELAELAGAHGVPLVADIGSGLLDARTPWLEGPPPPWLADEPAARQSLEAGAAVVLFSGDKLLGGPQAGIAVGERTAVAAMTRHPLARALRCDGPTLAALAATLQLYGDGRGGAIPFWAMATIPYAELEQRSHGVVAASGVDARVEEGRSLPGAGTVPGIGIPSPVIVVDGGVDERWHRLLTGEPAVVARREEDRLVLDLRAVPATQDGPVAESLGRACR